MKEQVFSLFPQTTGKIALMFTGGVESYLLGKLAVQLYGVDNVIFVVWLMDEYNVFYRKPEKRDRVERDFRTSVENVGGKHMFVVDNTQYHQFPGHMIDKTFAVLQSKHPDINYLIGGYNNVHRESLEVFNVLRATQDMSDLSRRGRLEVFSNKDKYPELVEFLTECDGMVYFVEEDFTKKTLDDLVTFTEREYFAAPLQNLTKTQVVMLYDELGWLTDLFKSNSCNRKGHKHHCGVCGNCLARRVAIRNAGINDETEYLV